MNLSDLPLIDAAAVARLLDWPTAMEALRRALTDGTAPGTTPLRTKMKVSAGELLMMPSQVGEYVGVKLLSSNSLDAGRGIPRIQGVFLLMDAATLTPIALLDATALTNIRTAAVSALAATSLAAPDAHRLLVFGTGPQALAHIQAIRSIRPIDRVTVVGRNQVRLADIIERCSTTGLMVTAGTPADVRDSDIVACCTSAAQPLFPSEQLMPHATVIAIGAHHPDSREVDTALVRRATVVVETRLSAFAEAGDIVIAVADGVPAEQAIDGELADLVQGRVAVDAQQPRLFKGVGEAWSDVVTAAAAFTNFNA